MWESLYPFSPQNLTLGDHTLSYLDEGKGHPVVMLHGNPTWSFYYRNLILRMRDRYRLIVPDHLGCGLSDKPQKYEYTLSNHIHNLTKLIDSLSLKKLSLMVHDWGGAIGMGYAVRNPDKIHSLVILNTAAFCSSHIPWRINLCRLPVVGELIIRGLNGFAWPATWMAVTMPLQSDVAKGYLAPYDSWRNRVAVHCFVRDIPLSENHRSWQTLVEIDTKLALLKNKPMLIQWGGKDFCFNDHFYAEWRKRFPSAHASYYADAGHYVLEDALDRVDSEVNRFLDEVVDGN